MFNETTLAKLEFTLTMIEDIEKIVERHGNPELTLHDMEGQYATLMCLLQIGESLSKIKEKDAVDKLPVDLAYKTRNIIVHSYTGVDLNIVKNILVADIPKLKVDIVNLLAQNDNA